MVCFYVITFILKVVPLALLILVRKSKVLIKTNSLLKSALHERRR